MRKTVMPEAGLITADELLRHPEKYRRYELVNGHLVRRMTPVNPTHASVAGRLIVLLGSYARDHRLGLVGPELGVKLRSNPDTVLAPDVAFIRQERIPDRLPNGFWPGPADLAIEVLSPDDRPADVRRKVARYLEYGTQLVLVVDPYEQSVMVHGRDAEPLTYTSSEQVVSLDPVVPGFGFTLSDIFA
ncbi:MAG: Uma2 family endonuclease [Vicinamibacterales bacterium]